ncbi:glycosyltransferase family 2 protein [Mailhella massiliensis]|uniref:glycosyltransferase family 2 protein n=1 Tax=Mailhella massiliensis TaxID=1903261 RepID=UPI0013900A79|nr:glycosyltransferase [Mailhella massiliensis]
MLNRKVKKLFKHPYLFFKDIGKKNVTEKQGYEEYKIMNNIKKDVNIDVSVIIPVFNVSKYIETCLKSLINQKNKNLEFIFVDDFSSDNSISIVEKYAKQDNRIIILKNSANLGCATTRNLAISIAKGKYIGFVDADDYISDNYFGSLYRIARIKDADIAMTNNVVRFPSKSIKHKNMGFSINKKIGDDQKINIINTTGVTWNKIYKREFLNKYLILFPEIHTMGTDNYITVLSLFFAKNIVTTDKSIYYYRENHNSIINKKKDASYYKLTDVYSRIITRILYSDKNKEIKNKWINSVINRFYKDTKSNLSKFETNLEKINYINYVYNQFPNIVLDDINRPIVSLTSYPARINTVYQTIDSILSQDIPPKKIVLYLAESQFPMKEASLPEKLISKINDIFEVRWCDDIRSYKKLIPALKDFPNDIIITGDDDVIYPKNWIRILLTGYYNDPLSVQCLRARRMVFENNKFSEYSKFRLIKDDSKASFLILQTGLGGCLYTKNMFYEDICKKELFTKLCPDGDDLWFWAMAVIKGTKIHWCAPGLNNPQYIENTQIENNTLWERNKIYGNDINIKNLIGYYNNKIINNIISE